MVLRPPRNESGVATLDISRRGSPDTIDWVRRQTGYITVQSGRGLEVFYRDGATWINDQDDKREMNKIEAPIRPTTPNYP